jgi:hypothetical protein
MIQKSTEIQITKIENYLDKLSFFNSGKITAFDQNWPV